jgi:hypothetical protein
MKTITRYVLAVVLMWVLVPATAVLVVGAERSGNVKQQRPGAKTGGGSKAQQQASEPDEKAKEAALVKRINAAVTSQLTSYYRSKQYSAGSSDVRVSAVSVKIEKTEPTPGWSNRYSTMGEATLTLNSRAGASKLVRRFDASSQVDHEGEITVDFNSR